ncbi:hypothetical protein P4O66_012660 [Electrophorus voltai]|uniref:RING-type domain-containing protein n=1 Tax=Electrophorus voltai TaxID=2609070 RepID=A0AAD8Z408_9TELE|nr:hypothetical protein P4O66_012660 [Electrophorus voltai]
MAEARVSVNLDQFSCPICLELLKDPVSIPCGHSFCMTCIKTKWDQDDQTGDYSCPLCRKTSTLRPDLGRNTVLAEMVEKLKNAHIAYRTLAGPEDVSCDVCIGQKCKAVKSCLKCLASYCRIHFNLHNELNPGNKHRMIDTKYNLAERICCAHDTLKDFFCHTEQEMVCCECIVNLCRGHKTTTLASERFSKLRMLGTIQTQFQQRTQETENKLKQLKKTKQSIKTFTKRILDQSEKIFSDLISLIERKRSKIMEMIRATEKAEVYRTEEILKSLEKEVEKLKQRDIEMAQLPHLEDDFLFFKTSKSLFDFSTLAHGPDITVNMSIFEGIQNTVSKIKEKVVILQQTELSKMLQTVSTLSSQDQFPKE